MASSQFAFLIAGAAAGDALGYTVSGAGDFNGDGYDDIIIGAIRADPPGRINAGKAYVIFGHSNATAFPNLLMADFITGNLTGFVVSGVAANDNLGHAVSGAGDVNDDGLDDIIIGTPYFDKGPGVSNSGVVYVIFGHTFTSDIDLLFNFTSSPSSGFRVIGSNNNGNFGYSVAAAGDVNNDGFLDL
eukprot:gene39159-biopygen2750